MEKEKMGKRISYRMYRVIRWFVKLFYPRIRVEGQENLPDSPCLVVANHSQMNGPIACELYFPGNRYTWCIGQMMNMKEVPAYAFRDFWQNKPKTVRWFYKLLSYVIAPFSVCVFQNAKTIGVYKDARIISTFKNTVKRLSEGASVVVFPEHDVPYNHIVCDFQDKFVDIARLYDKKTGQSLSFVPMYIAPKLKTMYIGKPIWFCADAAPDAERERICSYLKEEITRLALAQPPHRVVPYKNVPKKQYPMSRRG